MHTSPNEKHEAALAERLASVADDAEAALVCARQMREVDLSATEFVNLWGSSNDAGEAGKVPEPGVLKAVVLAADQRLLRRCTVRGATFGDRSAGTISYKTAGRIRDWKVEVDPNPDTMPVFRDGRHLDVEEAMSWLYAPVGRNVAYTLDGGGALHFQRASEATSFTENTAALLGEYGVEALITLTARLESVAPDSGTPSAAPHYYRSTRHVSGLIYRGGRRVGGEL